MPTIVATPGASDANSYETLAEFKTYLGSRLHIPAAVSSATDTTLETALIMATRGIDQIATRFRRLEIMPTRSGMQRFYVVRPHWTGTPATAIQLRAWPRVGMLNRNGGAIPTDVVPQDLKDATSEMAMLVITTDLTKSNSVVDQGISSVNAGPVSVSFKEYIQKRVFPDVVYQVLVASWLTDEAYENAQAALFRIAGRVHGRRW